MNEEEQKRIDDMLATLREGCWMGEYGSAACIAKTKGEALRKIKQLMRDDVGDQEARELKTSDISIGWARLATPKDREEEGFDYNECDWYVMFAEKSPYKCYVLHYTYDPPRE